MDEGNDGRSLTTSRWRSATRETGGRCRTLTVTSSGRGPVRRCLTLCGACDRYHY